MQIGRLKFAALLILAIAALLASTRADAQAAQSCNWSEIAKESAVLKTLGAVRDKAHVTAEESLLNSATRSEAKSIIHDAFMYQLAYMTYGTLAYDYQACGEIHNVRPGFPRWKLYLVAASAWAKVFVLTDGAALTDNDGVDLSFYFHDLYSVIADASAPGSVRSRARGLAVDMCMATQSTWPSDTRRSLCEHAVSDYARQARQDDAQERASMQRAAAAPRSPQSAAPNLPHPSPVECSHDASVATLVSPDYPDVARDLNFGPVSVVVEVSLDANGHVTSAKVISTTGMPSDLSTDAAKAEAAREITNEALRVSTQSTYLPAVRNCKPVATKFAISAQFNPY